jgi:DNA-binding MarR family transcriptional regulator
VARPARRDPTEFIDKLGALRRCMSALAAQAYAGAGLGLGSTQAKLMRHIGAHGPISQAELARATGSDPALTGRALQTLIERGWVRRQRSDQDRREYVLELGAEGRRARARVEKLRSDLAARVVGVLDARDLEAFDRVAGKILATFEPAAAADAVTPEAAPRSLRSRRRRSPAG